MDIYRADVFLQSELYCYIIWIRLDSTQYTNIKRLKSAV